MQVAGTEGPAAVEIALRKRPFCEVSCPEIERLWNYVSKISISPDVDAELSQFNKPLIDNCLLAGLVLFSTNSLPLIVVFEIKQEFVTTNNNKAIEDERMSNARQAKDQFKLQTLRM